MSSFKKSFLYLPLIVLALACSKDQDNVSLYFASDTYTVDFYSLATIPAPIADGFNTPPSFSLQQEISGIEVDADTGSLSIKRSLNVGEHKVVVVAKDIENKKTATVQIVSVLKRSFWSGGQSNAPDSYTYSDAKGLHFFDDGTVEVLVFDDDTAKGTGVWTIDNNEVEIRFCTYCEDIEPRDIFTYDGHLLYKGILENGVLECTISGQWYSVNLAPEEKETLKGNFKLDWD